MSRRRSKRYQGLNLSLFPFLAVLICTMGVLIVLLVIVSRQADLSARNSNSDAKQELLSKIEQLEIEQETESFRAEGYRELQDGLRERLEEARLRRSHLENEIRELEEQAKRLQEAFARLETPSQDRGELQNLAETRQQLAQQLELAKSQQESALERVQVASRTYAVVPYPGPNGTTRRPIYVECKADGIYLQPHGIRLTEKELQMPLLAGNPFDAALLAVREYWNKYDVQQDSEPYPLIIVRPGGAESYAVVRKAMKSWDDEFGYELVSDDAELEFPGKDERLAALLEDVIAKATVRQSELLRALALQQRALEMKSGFSGNPSRSDSGSDQVVLQAKPGSGGFEITQGSAPSANRSVDTQQNSSQPWNTQSDSQGTGSALDRYTESGSQDRTTVQTGSYSGSSKLEQYYGASQRGSDQTRSTESNSNGQSLNGTFASNSGSNTFRQRNGQQSNSTDAIQQSNRSNSFAQGPGGASSSISSGTPPIDSIAESRGQEWAIPGKAPNATAYRRPIHIELHADHMIVLPGSYSREPTRMISIDDQRVRPHIDEMVDGVWRLIDSWDFAGYNAYWKPELHVRVHSGADAQFAELQQLMAGSGLDVVRKAQ